MVASIGELRTVPLDHHLGQLAEQPARAGQLQPAAAGPLGKLAQDLLVGRRQLRLVLLRASDTSVTGISSRLRSYVVEIEVPHDQLWLSGIALGAHWVTGSWS